MSCVKKGESMANRFWPKGRVVSKNGSERERS